MEVEPVQKGDHTGTVDMDLSFLVLIRICILNNNWLSYSFVKWVEYFVAFMGAVYVASMTQVDDDFSEKALNAIKLFVSFLILTVLVGIIVSPTKALYTGENSYSAIRNALASGFA